MRRVIIAVLLLGASGCGSEQQAQSRRDAEAARVATPIPPQTPPDGAELTPEQQAAYDRCLQDNMAVAMAWAVIERNCLEQATGAKLAPPQ